MSASQPKTARFRAAYPAVGLSPDGGLSWTLTRALGGSAALHTILGNLVITAADLHAMGLIAATCPDDDLDRAVDDFVRQIMSIPAEAVAATKQLIRGAHNRDFTVHLEHEAAAIAPPVRIGRCRRHARGAHPILVLPRRIISKHNRLPPHGASKPADE